MKCDKLPFTNYLLGDVHPKWKILLKMAVFIHGKKSRDEDFFFIIFPS